MTQVRVGGTRMRNINRVEGLSNVQKVTRSYFDKVRAHVHSNETIFSEAEVQLRILGEPKQSDMKEQIDKLLKSMGESVRDFMALAVHVEDYQAIDEVTSSMDPVRSDSIGLTDQLKDLRSQGIMREMREAFKPADSKANLILARGKGKWDYVRRLEKSNVLRSRLVLKRTQLEMRGNSRKHVQMQLQALVGEYSADKDFCSRIGRQAGDILSETVDWSLKNGREEDVQTMMRMATALQVDTTKMQGMTGTWVLAICTSACKHSVGLERVLEVLDVGSKIALAAKTPFESMCDLTPVAPSLAERAVVEIEALHRCLAVASKLPKWQPRPGKGIQLKPELLLPQSVNRTAGLRNKLGHATKIFDDAFWAKLKEHYDSRELQAKVGVGNWAAAYTEQIKVSMPKWMMTKSQVEAVHKLEKALNGGDESQLKEAVIFAKQADYKSEQKLVTLFDDALVKLRTLKCLPAGWEVGELLGDDLSHKMFRKVDIDNPVLRGLMQKMFDVTKASISTRDREGAVPRGYRVERIDSVMNADTWEKYIKRREKIVGECSKFATAAPCPKDLWDLYGGGIQAVEEGKAILAAANVPPLEENANEFLLFHGTKAEAADNIAKNHFDMSMACKTGLFGAGLYFAESISKGDEYVKPDGRNHFPVILARVSLGRMNYCDKKDPVKDPGTATLRDSCLKGGYHSVLGDRKKVRGTYREFIVYDSEQVYPHFIVWYTRM